MPALVTFRADNKIYLLTDKTNTATSFDTVQDGINYFERAYKRHGALSYESIMSVCINNLTFSPAVHQWDHEDLAPLIGMNIIDMKTFRGYRLRNVSGVMTGALLTREKAEEFHESGRKPSTV